MRPVVLVLDDEAEILKLLKTALTEAGYDVLTAASVREFEEIADQRHVDVYLVDVGLPDGNGFSLVRDLRPKTDSGIILLTGRDNETDHVVGLELGADDYVTKPFRFEELLARIRLRLRENRAPEAMVLRRGDLSLDLRTRRAEVDGRTVDLSAREFALAEVFLRHPGQVFSREQLLSRVWGYDFDPGSNVVDVYVRYLRRKLGADRVETVRGVGYRLI